MNKSKQCLPIVLSFRTPPVIEKKCSQYIKFSQSTYKNIFDNFRMSDSRLSFYPEEEDGGRQYSLVARQPSQLEEIFRSCRLVSSELLSEAQQAATTVNDQAQGVSS